MGTALELAKTVAKAGWRIRYNRMQGREAAKVLAGLEGERGKLSPALRRRCDDYAREVFGSRVYAPWLYVYTCVAGEFREGWIPDNFYGERVVSALYGRYGAITTLRALNRKLFEADEFPDIGACINGRFVDRDLRPIPEDRLTETIFARGDRVVYKLDRSLQGIGIHFFDRAGFDPARVRKLGNGLFQPFVRQHEVFDRFTSASVATLRLTTAVDEAGTPSLRAAFLRMGRGKETHVLTETEIDVFVDLATGDLGERGFLHDWTTVPSHPDSGTAFAGVTVPNYADCVKLVLDCHRRMAFLGCIGWDLAVDRDGAVKIIEWNGGHNDIVFGEAGQGPCFRDLNWERFRR